MTTDEIIESAVSWAVEIANDNTHGYSQQTRWGPSYDCASLVISAWEQAGVLVKTGGATYTGNMLAVFKRKGFTDVTASCNLKTGSGMQRGDVLLNTANHTALHIGSGKIVHARSSEGTTDTKDGSGNEIRTQAYWNYPWNYVLRYTGGSTGSTSTSSESTTTLATICSLTMPEYRSGSTGTGVKNLQLLLNAIGCSCGTADGEFGTKTLAGVKKYQTQKGLTADGIVGTATWNALFPAK